MRPLYEHNSNLDTDGDKRSRDANESQNNRPAILAFDSEHNDKLKVVTFLDLIRLSHFEPSLARAVRQSGEARNAANRFDH